MIEITAEIRAIIDKAAAGVELAGDEYIDPADGLIHCKKCKGLRQTIVPNFGKPGYFMPRCICQCQREAEEQRKAAEERQRRMERIKRRNAAKKKELEAAEKRIGELSAIFKRLYEDSVSGRISDERFTELSADYEAEQQELKERVARIQAELSKAQEATVNAEKFMNIVRKHMNFEELTHTLLREFVEKIVVHECSYDENGTRRQDIEIYYSFVGKVDLPE